jgi:cellulase/cellobiase CelA1
MATESPNQPMLLTLTKMVGAAAGSTKRAAELLAEQVLVADVGREALALPANEAWPDGHRG